MPSSLDKHRKKGMFDPINVFRISCNSDLRTFEKHIAQLYTQKLRVQRVWRGIVSSL